MDFLNPYPYLNEINSWLVRLPLAYAFVAGMAASVNPCGFMMLPSFAAFYLGTEGGEQDDLSPLERGFKALRLGLLATLGFVAIFGLVGLIVGTGGRWLVEVFPWTSLVIGSGLVLLGIWLLLPGQALYVAAASRVSIVEGRGPASVFAFGVAYAVASLGCTLPIFLVVVSSALAAQGVFSAVIQFLNYALGMGLVLIAITLSLAYFRSALVRRIRSALFYVESLAPLFLILAGAYLIYFWFRYGRLLV